MSKRFSSLLAAALAASLAGCGYRAGYDDLLESPFYPPPVGATLTLTRPLTIPAGRVGRYLQRGVAVAAADTTVPFCRFEVLTLSDRPRRVAAGRFDIVRVARERGLAAHVDRRYQFAARRWWLFNQDASPLLYRTRLGLRSAAHPDVHQLWCARRADDALAGRHLSVRELQAVLGELIELRL